MCEIYPEIPMSYEICNLCLHICVTFIYRHRYYIYIHYTLYNLFINPSLILVPIYLIIINIIISKMIFDALIIIII